MENKKINFNNDTIKLLGSCCSQPNLKGWLLKCNNTNRYIILSIAKNDNDTFDIFLDDENNFLNSIVHVKDYYKTWDETTLCVTKLLNDINLSKEINLVGISANYTCEILDMYKEKILKKNDDKLFPKIIHINPMNREFFY